MSSAATNDGSFPGPLAGVVDYQEGTIVSKILGKTSGGSATMFAFAEGQELSEHSAPFDALIYLVEGEARIGVGQDSATAAAGDLVRLPANVPHSVAAITAFKMLLIMLRERDQ